MMKSHAAMAQLSLALTLSLVIHIASCLPAKLTVLIVADGLKPEYVSKAATPNVHSLVETGISVKGVTPVFPALKYPNVASLLTGVYAERHNVLDSVVFDRKEGRNIFMNEAGFWNSTRDIKTIWVTIRVAIRLIYFTW